MLTERTRATADGAQFDTDFEDDAVIAENTFGRYSIPRTFLSREVPGILMSGGVYEPETLDFLCEALAQSRRDIVTGGAFVGDFFPALHRSLAPDAQIHSFEPLPLTFRAAQETLRLNGLDRVTLAKVAVGEADGILPLQVSRKETGEPLAAAARIAPKASGAHVMPVRVVPLDQLIPQDRPVGILHLDIEGHEAAALRGAQALIARNRPIIVLEAGRPKLRRAYLQYLNETFPDIGYRRVGLMEGNLILQPDA